MIRLFLIMLLCPNADAAFWNLGRSDKKDILAPAQGYFEQRSYHKTIETINGLSSQRLPSKIQKNAYWYLGQSYERTANLDKALSTYQLAAHLYPKEQRFSLALAGLYHRVGLDDRARPLFETLLEKDRENTQAHIGLAETLETLGFLSIASEHYRTALNLSGNDGSLWLTHASCLLKQRRFVEAENAALQSRDLAPENADAALVLAVISFSRGNLKEALSRIDQADSLSPGRRDIILRRALWLAAAGRTKEALADAGRILAKNPLDPLALWTEAMAHMKAGRLPEAAASFKKHPAGNSSFVSETAEAMLLSIEPVTLKSILRGKNEIP